jgi:diguanylate cyclase (GGDEF)-like protein
MSPDQGLRARLTAMRHSLIWRLAAVGLVLMLFGLAMRMLVVVPHLRDEMANVVAQQQETLAQFVAQDIDTKLRTRQDSLTQLAQTLPATVLDNPRQLNSWLATHRPSVSGLFTHLQLMPVRASQAVWWPGQPDAMTQALRQGQTVIGRPSKDPVSGQAEVLFSAPVRDGQGQTVAILVAGLPVAQPGFLDSLLKQHNEQAADFLLIAPQYGLYVATADPSRVLAPTPAPGLNPLHDRAMAGFRGKAVGTSIQGIQNIAAIADVPSAGWFLSARVPYRVLDQPIDQVRRLFAKASAGQMVFFFGFVMLVLRTMLRPLTQAASQLRRMASGGEPLHPLPVVHEDEVGELAKGFNHLLQQLETHMATLRANETRLAQMARHDPLTQLPNRSVLHDRLEQASHEATRLPHTVSLMFLDLDGFKVINDRHGHQVGDGVLQEVAHRLTHGRRKADLVVRLGGDEFVILLQTSTTDSAAAACAAERVAQQCITVIQRPFHLLGHTLQLGVSIGIAHQQPGQSAEFLLIEADTAMYAAKHAGRNRHCTYDASMRGPVASSKNTL